jgi:hypothetical protein
MELRGKVVQNGMGEPRESAAISGTSPSGGECGEATKIVDVQESLRVDDNVEDVVGDTDSGVSVGEAEGSVAGGSKDEVVLPIQELATGGKVDRTESIDGKGVKNKNKEIKEKLGKGKNNNKITDPVRADMEIQCSNDRCSSKREGWRTAKELGLVGESHEKIQEVDLLCALCSQVKLGESEKKVIDLEQRVKVLEEMVHKLMGKTKGTVTEADRVVELVNSVRREGEGKVKLNYVRTPNGNYITTMPSQVTKGAWEKGRPSLPGENSRVRGSNLTLPIMNAQFGDDYLRKAPMRIVADDTDKTKRNERGVDGQWTVVRREKKKRAPIVIVGDSMITHVRNVIKCEEEGSSCLSMRGAGIKQVVEKACMKAEEMGEGILVIQGGGNGLTHLGVRENVKVIMDGVNKIREVNRKVKVAVVGVLPRPRETGEYEGMRGEVNRWLHNELRDMRGMQIRGGDPNPITYLDPSHLLGIRHYARDGVHLNREGVNIVGRNLLGWVTEAARESSLSKD